MGLKRQTTAFYWAWAGSTTSMLGSRTLSVAYPLLALTLNGSAVEAGWVGFAWTVPALLFYIPAGALVDRWNHRRVMLYSEAVRGCAVISVCALLAVGRLELGHLLAVAFVEGALGVFYSLAVAALIPSLAAEGRLLPALASSETSNHAAVLIGRPLGGFLFGIGQAIPFLVNSGLFILSIVATTRLPRTASGTPPATDDAPTPGGMLEGFRELWQFRTLRAATAMIGLTNAVVHALIMVFVALAVSENVTPLNVGWAMAATGVGGVLGALGAPLSQRWARRFLSGTWSRRPPRIKRVSMLLVHTWLWVIALLIPLVCGTAWWSFALALAVMGLAGARSNITIRTLIALHVHPGKAARVLGVYRLVGYSTIALGPLLGGMLMNSAGPTGAVVVLLSAMLAFSLPATFWPPARRTFFHEGPQPPATRKGTSSETVALKRTAETGPGPRGASGGQPRGEEVAATRSGEVWKQPHKPRETT
ncbi:MFS transporter [Thermopolyspora sp. NPDC052614]|uniref:MFS transporter n=1 Tax=Thermopolyspora sp. NPDC052614 TaxID=3155682 RepID=UPI00341DA090